MSADYRIVHFLAIISIGALLATGLTNTGFSLLYHFHVDFGLACGAALAVYSLIVLARHRVRLFDALSNPINSQIKEAFAVIGRFLLGRPYPSEVKSRIGRHNVLATYATLILALSFIPLTLGGVSMISLQGGTLLYEEMDVLHVFGVDLIALFFLAHVFALFNAENRPLLKAMFSNGRVSLDWAKEHLADYLRKSASEN